MEFEYSTVDRDATGRWHPFYEMWYFVTVELDLFASILENCNVAGFIV